MNCNDQQFEPTKHLDRGFSVEKRPKLFPQSSYPIHRLLLLSANTQSALAAEEEKATFVKYGGGNVARTVLFERETKRFDQPGVRLTAVCLLAVQYYSLSGLHYGLQRLEYKV